jgi:two-component sensor histidine kinase
MIRQAEVSLNPIDLAALMNEIAQTLAKGGFFMEAMKLNNESVEIIKKTYATDLSKKLANYESNLVAREKEKEILMEQEKTKFYIITAILIGLLLVLAITAFLRKSVQTKKIIEQRDTILKKDAEKELLLKEIHHRVKNNLQVVSSLLDLQSRDIDDEKTLSTFMEGQNRVKAMALIHQKLYQNENLAAIDFSDYAKQLIKELAILYPSAKGVSTNVQAKDNTQFDIDTAIPLGLILNELISNAYKYAFEGKESGELNVSLKALEGGKHLLTVEDSGVGLPEGFEFSKAKSLGLRLVRRLAKQLYGEVEYTHNQGVRFAITFTDTAQRKVV